MRTDSRVLVSVVLSCVWGVAGCKVNIDAPRLLREELSDLREVLRTGPPTLVVAGPGDGGAFLEDGSRWAAEEIARVLRLEGFRDIVGSRGAAVEPVREVEVVGPGTLEDLTRLAKERGAGVIVFVGLRSVELRESAPRLIDWTYDGKMAVRDTEKNRLVEWGLTGEARKQAPNDVPADPALARRPLAEEWARDAFRKGAWALGFLGTDGD